MSARRNVGQPRRGHRPRWLQEQLRTSGAEARLDDTLRQLDLIWLDVGNLLKANGLQNSVEREAAMDKALRDVVHVAESIARGAVEGGDTAQD